MTRRRPFVLGLALTLFALGFVNRLGPVNAVAQTSEWPVWLSWSGLLSYPTVPVGQGLPADVNSDASPTWTVGPLSFEPALRTTLKGLLRRFVSGRWIADRLGQDLD